MTCIFLRILPVGDYVAPMGYSYGLCDFSIHFVMGSVSSPLAPAAVQSSV